MMLVSTYVNYHAPNMYACMHLRACGLLAAPTRRHEFFTIAENRGTDTK